MNATNAQPKLASESYSRRELLGSAAALSLSLLSLPARSLAEDEGQLQRGTAPGNKFPEIQLLDVQGNVRAPLEREKGKLILLDFWAVWCQPCIQEIRQFNREYGGLKDKNFQVKDDPTQPLGKGFSIVSVAFNDRPEYHTQWKSMVQKNQFTWKEHVELTDSQALGELFAVRAFPTKYLLDHNGIVIAQSVGGVRGSLRQFLSKYAKIT